VEDDATDELNVEVAHPERPLHRLAGHREDVGKDLVQRALELGLLNEIVPAESLLERAHEWARRINANGPLAVRATKESVLRGLAVDQKEAYAIETELAGKVFSSEDAKEGPKAFAEKRDPVWTGR
jgi:enoyl-CoA hydratase